MYCVHLLLYINSLPSLNLYLQTISNSVLHSAVLRLYTSSISEIPRNLLPIWASLIHKFKFKNERVPCLVITYYIVNIMNTTRRKCYKSIWSTYRNIYNSSKLSGKIMPSIYRLIWRQNVYYISYVKSQNRTLFIYLFIYYSDR